MGIKADLHSQGAYYLEVQRRDHIKDHDHNRNDHLRALPHYTDCVVGMVSRKGRFYYDHNATGEDAQAYRVSILPEAV